jgi:hypothetical protein
LEINGRSSSRAVRPSPLEGVVLFPQAFRINPLCPGGSGLGQLPRPDWPFAFGPLHLPQQRQSPRFEPLPGCNVGILGIGPRRRRVDRGRLSNGFNFVQKCAIGGAKFCATSCCQGTKGRPDVSSGSACYLRQV